MKTIISSLKKANPYEYSDEREDYGKPINEIKRRKLHNGEINEEIKRTENQMMQKQILKKRTIGKKEILKQAKI